MIAALQVFCGFISIVVAFFAIPIYIIAFNRFCRPRIPGQVRADKILTVGLVLMIGVLWTAFATLAPPWLTGAIYGLDLGN